MASRIKGITIEIGGNTTKLQSALKDTNKTIADTKSELRDVEKLLKLDPSNTELLEQKQKLLKKAVGETADKLETLKDAEKQAQEQFKKGEITEKQYDALKREIVATTEDLKKLETQAKNTNLSLNGIAETNKKIGSAAGKVAGATAGVSAGAGGLLAGLVGSGLNAAKTADDLATLSKQTGFTTQELQKMQYASDLVDVSVSDMTGALAKMKKQMGSDSGAEKFAELGISVRDAEGNLRDANTVFYETLLQLSKIDNETQKDTVAMEIFGKGADSLAGIIDDGGLALRNYGHEAEQLGIIMDDETVDSLVSANDEIDKLKNQAMGEFLSVGAKALEALAPILSEIIDKLSGVFEWISSLTSEDLGLIMTILGIVAAISPIAGIISGISGAIGILLANPVVAVITAIIAVITAITILIVKNWDKIKAILESIWEKVKEVFTKIGDFVKGAINGFLGLINSLIGGINKLIAGINKLQFDVPDWVPIIGGMTFGFNIPEIPSIPLLANGGVVMNGNSAIVGDRGAELLTMNNGRAYVQPLSGGTHITQTNNFTNYQPRDGANAARNLNRQLGWAY